MKEIEMTATRNDSNQDVFRLRRDAGDIDVIVTEDGGTNELKGLFSYLLEELFEDDVMVKFVPTTDYKTTLYEEVCREYIDVLNGELRQARQKILDNQFS